MALDYQRLGRQIRTARQAQGLTQGELGERLGCSGPTVSGWETGRRRISLDDLYRASMELGKPMTWFLDIELSEALEQQLRTVLQKTIGDFLPTFYNLKGADYLDHEVGPLKSILDPGYPRSHGDL